MGKKKFNSLFLRSVSDAHYSLVFASVVSDSDEIRDEIKGMIKRLSEIIKISFDENS